MNKKSKYFILFILISGAILIMADRALADEENEGGIPFTPQAIGQIGFNDKVISPASIGNLVKAVYVYGLGIVGITATLVMMYGGVLYITAAGNASKADNAKQWIFSSLTGLTIALFSYTVLYVINPNLLAMTPIKPIKPEKKQGDTIIPNASINTTIGNTTDKCEDGNCVAGCKVAGYESGACVENKCWCRGKVADPHYKEYSPPDRCPEAKCKAYCVSAGYTAGTCSHYLICECTGCIDTGLCPKIDSRR